MNNRKGFSLIELLTVLIIFSLLTIIAYPSYTAWILKSRRSDAMVTITQLQSLLERCYAQAFTYVGCATLPAFPRASPQGFYSVAMTNLTATTYTLTATPVGSQVRDTICASMSTDQSGQKTAVNSGGAAQTVCWTP